MHGVAGADTVRICVAHTKRVTLSDFLSDSLSLSQSLSPVGGDGAIVPVTIRRDGFGSIGSASSSWRIYPAEWFS